MNRDPKTELVGQLVKSFGKEEALSTLHEILDNFEDLTSVSFGYGPEITFESKEEVTNLIRYCETTL